MGEVVGRAGFHVKHAKSVSERGAILHEMMREFDDDSIAYWAARNPNIVVADEHLNEAMVNDGAGGFRACTDRQEVIEYGDERLGRVKRKIREDKLDPKTRKMKGGTITTSLIVSHLPKSMCEEIADFYPVLDSKTGEPVLDGDGQPMRRSRWVARDRDEARRYFEDVVEHLGREVIPGGRDAVLGYDIQHSESTPHVQVMADTFAPDPWTEGALRVETSRAWLSHRDVLDEQGRQKSGKTKLSEYHAGLKEHLIGLGYDVSPDFDEKRHLVGMGKDEYSRAMDAQRVVEHRGTRVAQDEQKLNAWDDRLRDAQADLRLEREELEQKRKTLSAREQALEDELEALPKYKHKIREQTETQVRDNASEIIRAEADRKLGPDREALRRHRERLEEETEKAVSHQQAYADAAARFDALNARLQPAVEKWEQRNPHTKEGRRVRSQIEVAEQIRTAAHEIRKDVPDPDPQPGD